MATRPSSLTKNTVTAKRGTKKASVSAKKTADSLRDDISISTGKALVIVESPAKAKTINKYLGSQYIVKSSVGHVRDLPTSSSAKEDDKAEKTSKAASKKASAADKEAEKKNKQQQALIRRMGVDPEHDWQAQYEILPGKESVVAELKKLAKNANHIYLATDLDREGEAIAWHLKEVIGGDDQRFSRVVFNEITQNAIQTAFKNPSKLDLNRVNAQQARRFLDRVVGYMLSPLLWEKIARGLSAGRVQSVATKLVVEREREIRAFIPEEYWEIHVDTLTNKQPLQLEAVKEAGKTLHIPHQQAADALVNKLNAATFTVSEKEEKPTKANPSAPFITSTLQQAASTRLGFSVKKTMMMAQRLYEAGHITYMRTDSTFLSVDAENMARQYIAEQFGEKYLPKSPNRYGNKAGAQEAHEAIRPSNVALKGDQLSAMERDAQRLYDLIWRQFLACQMPPAEYLSSTITVMASDVELKAKGRTLVFDGFTKIAGQQKNDDVLLPVVKKGEVLERVAVLPSQHFTKPPARYTEASLVKELEKKGIGRPSTYASIISTIQERGYVRLDNKRLYAEKMGDIVTERLNENFNNLMDYSFTAALEGELDKVAEGARDWKNLLNEFYAGFKQKLTLAKGYTDPKGHVVEGMRRNVPVEIPEVICPTCNIRPMQIRTGSTGVFLGCSGYALPPKERCKGTVNLIPQDTALEMATDDDARAELSELLAKKRCPIDGVAMDSYVIDGTRMLHICGNNPDCSGHLVEHGEFKVVGYTGPSHPCDKCATGQLELKTGRFGPFYACNTCDNTRKALKNGDIAPPRAEAIHLPHVRSQKHDDYFVLRDGAAGLFLAASKFPKVRETRPPLVQELRSVKAELDPKFVYLLDAPDTDPEGNLSQVRYSRKMACQYIMSEQDGKPTKWQLFYKDGRWTAS